ncbi:DUF3383 family protein [Brevibacillus laterosporus]|uniref:DUF3383 family protein n=1 Tax=Brevibacillus laterosporus TaxID=1465 RepID=UPI0014446D83|nr:DUF3383 family protein [Brevibacillus laterosporus]NKQ20500.1 DUF3383 domain-containing protein [Brevibacillus laterosporus]WNX32600.1 DUF3383 family protein [Brevibacillus laterosporus]
MALEDVKVIIDLQKPSGRLGFGVPLILGQKKGGHAYKKYYGLDEVQTDFPDTTLEYKMAKAIFLQGDKAPAFITIVAKGTEEEETYTSLLESLSGKGWYFVLMTAGTEADYMAINEHLQLLDYGVCVARVTTKEEAAALQAKKLERTMVWYHPNAAQLIDAAVVGAIGSAQVGSVTWKFKELKGIDPVDLTSGGLQAIHDAGANTYVMKAGEPRTSEGKLVYGEYIDTIHGKDFVKYTMEKELQHLLNNTPKIPYTNAGISLIEGRVTKVLTMAYQQGIIADENGIPLYSMNFKKRNEVSEQDRAERTYQGGSFAFELAGAIHETTVKGIIRY